jgi:hypothetical protein
MASIPTADAVSQILLIALQVVQVVFLWIHDWIFAGRYRRTVKCQKKSSVSGRSRGDGDLPRVKQLIESGYNVNAFDDLSYAPLHYAAKGSSLLFVANFALGAVLMAPSLPALFLKSWILFLVFVMQTLMQGFTIWLIFTEPGRRWYLKRDADDSPSAA